MGAIVVAAKVSHVPSVYLGEPGVYPPYEGVHENLREGLRAIRRRLAEEGAETVVVLDTHWITTVDHHLNAAPRHQGVYTSEEQPHVLHDYEYDYPGDPELATAWAQMATTAGITMHAHNYRSLRLTYGTLVPLHYLNPDRRLKVLPIGMNINASPEENARLGTILAETVRRSGRRVGLIASGSLSHAFWPNDEVKARRWEISSEFNRQVDLHVIDLLTQGRVAEVIDMIPVYRKACAGECGMADTSLLFGALGGKAYRGKALVLGEYCGSGGNGQVVLEFPVAA
ncbi:MAG: 3,4-dihydroxyphenylacetate 2,3-dioxygenase [Deltaproteobacteria bacterium]|nr:3,4-dihydroxyphenylacetate 2,3-dioxygenase [Deltaproteobacteria bacterium]MBI3079566.1 3,4-dihydroxyphenylacetate 2,3-dioxygenase [Deltaproteobacteria bacterium]